MHEASIALSVLEISEQACLKAGLARVESICVRVGAASGILPDALQTAFNIVKTGTIAGNARLIVTHVPLGGSCQDCGGEFSTEEAFILACPVCGGKDFHMKRGRELDITEIEAS